MDGLLEAEARSPPLPKLDGQAPKTLPSLPTEILQRIIQLALPRLSYKTFRERYDVLLILCRVNKLWASLAREELWRHLGLIDRQTAQILLSVLPIAEAGGPTIRSLRLLFSSDDWEAHRLQSSQAEALMAASPRLRVLHIVTAQEPHASLDWESLSAVLRDLEDLTLDFTTLILRPPESILPGPRLRRLTLAFPPEPTFVATLLSSVDFPNLNALVVLIGREFRCAEDLVTLGKVLVDYSARLKAFTFAFASAARHTKLEDAVWSSFTNLLTLALDYDSPFVDILPLLSAPVVGLRLRPPYSYDERFSLHSSFHVLINAMSSSPKVLDTLERIVIPSREEWMVEHDEAARCSLAEICLGRGIELVEKPNDALDDYIEYVEDALDAW
ncbi:hypothetical protein BCR35DRAFT_297934 [Leucosporidium creatinivorum]|uniref:F-box domain-containing protein n=1 Tax=Leucosporidium creatinivorum TaxID=106004 RepID=A0A1Y2G7F5_9BASI|nr:hypothetical protein BCR35DRAFT_297934 [Leucosporidium creatinivorum]